MNGNAKKKFFTLETLVFTALMAAVVCVATFLRIPLLGSKVHLGNTAGLLAGLLLGGPAGGIAAGLGSALNDLVSGYSIDEVFVTFVSKFVMAYVCGVLIRKKTGRGWATLACTAGAFSYVALYMLKTFVYRRFVYGLEPEAVWAVMLSKLPASLINAVFALIAAPLLYLAIRPALEKAGLLQKLK